MLTNRKIDWLNHGLEFIIVVVGILLAFQLNTWSQENKQRRVLQEHIASLEEETAFNLSNIKYSAEQGAIEQQNIDSMLTLVKAGHDIMAMNQMAFRILKIDRVYIQKNAYNTLTTSGDIRFIKDFQLKEDIINLYEYYSWTEAMDKINLEFYINNYYPYVMDNFDMLTGQVQDADLYTAKKFKNILASYRFQAVRRNKKVDDCYEKVKEFVDKRGWEIDQVNSQK